MGIERPEDAGNTDGLHLHAAHSTDERIAAAKVIGSLAGGNKLSDSEREKAHMLLETLSRDSETRVRAALSTAIAEYPFLPPSLAQALALDVLEVAGPILEKSPALSDDFLIELIGSGNACENAQIKISRRGVLPKTLANTLLVSDAPQVAETILSNPGAEVDRQGLLGLLERENLDSQVLTLVVERSDLCEMVVERCHQIGLTDQFDRKVGEGIRDQLIQKYALPPAMAEAIVQAALEDALTQVSSDTHSARADFDLLAKRLHPHGDLTPSLLLRMVCGGSLDFAVSAFHVLTGRPSEQIETIFSSAGTTALADLYLESGLDSYFRFALTTAIKRMAAEKNASRHTDPERPVADIIHNIVDFYRGISPASIDHVIACLNHESDRWGTSNDASPDEGPIENSNAR